MVDQIARQSVGKDWSLYAALIDHWSEIVGTDYARVTNPAKMTFPHQPNEPRRCKGTLIIKLPKGLAMEFSFKTEQIRQRINSYFGYDAVAKICFEPVFGSMPEVGIIVKPADPAALTEIHEGAQSVENEELRAALASFGETVLTHTD